MSFGTRFVDPTPVDPVDPVTESNPLGATEGWEWCPMVHIDPYRSIRIH